MPTEKRTQLKEAKENWPTAQKEKGRRAEMLKKLSGSSHEELSLSIVQSTCDAFPKTISTELALSVTSQTLQEMAPNDPTEAMLCSQIIGLNAQGMRYLARAESENNLLCHTEAAVNMAVKLLRLKNETIETLIRYRRKGEQKVLVQHINITDEAKAIIGDITTQGGGGNV